MFLFVCLFICVFLGFGVLLYRGSVVLLFLVVHWASRALVQTHGQKMISRHGYLGFAALADMGNRFASHVDMGNRFAERVSWGARTPAFQVRLCGVRFAAGALPALSGQGKHETGRVDSPGAGCLEALVGPAQKTPFFGRFRDARSFLFYFGQRSFAGP